MSKYEASGTVRFIGQTETKGTFTFRKFVVTTEDDPRYPQQIEFQATKGEIGSLDSIMVGDEVTVTFNVRGREWKSPSGDTKYFVTLDAWRIEMTKRATGRGEPVPSAKSQAEIDDIPF